MATWTYFYPKNKYPLGLDYNPAFGELVDLSKATFKSESKTQVVFSLVNGLQLKILGTGFDVNSKGVATAGTITSLQIVDKGGNVFQSITGLSKSLVDAQDAADGYDAWGLQEWLFSGDDKVVGSKADDDLYGFAGNDTITGGAGDDYMEGRAGKDTYDGGDGWDTLSFQDSYYITSSLKGITLDATAGTVTDHFGNKETFKNMEGFRGTHFADVMNGSSKDEAFMGLGGNDKIDGKGGFDMVMYHRDQRFGGKGVTVDLTKGTATDGFGKTDTLVSIEGARGTESADKLIGSAASNYLRGDGGDDVLSGKGGNDQLEGGGGKDTFLFDVAPNRGSNYDDIYDFVVADDTIKLDNAVFKVFKTTGVLASGEFVKNTSGKAADSKDHIIYETDTGNIYYDADGKGGSDAIHFATVSKDLAITAADFVIV